MLNAGFRGVFFCAVEYRNLRLHYLDDSVHLGIEIVQSNTDDAQDCGILRYELIDKLNYKSITHNRSLPGGR